MLTDPLLSRRKRIKVRTIISLLNQHLSDIAPQI
jgi:hypothetical protein